MMRTWWQSSRGYHCERWFACRLLGRLEHEAAGATDALWNVAQRDDSPNVRRAAIIALGAIGTAAQKFLPEMKRLLETSEMTEIPLWHHFLTEAIEKIEGDFD